MPLPVSLDLQVFSIKPKTPKYYTRKMLAKLNKLRYNLENRQMTNSRIVGKQCTVKAVRPVRVGGKMHQSLTYLHASTNSEKDHS